MHCPVIQCRPRPREETVITPVLPTYARVDLEFERGEGPYLIAADGTRYLDFLSGIGVSSFGHGHPQLLDALVTQAGKLWHTSNVFRIPGQETLATRLIDATFADTVFFTNSGAEAVECALKMCRKYHHDTGHPERYRIITFDGAFHGRTLATIAAGGKEKLLGGFGPPMEGYDQVPLGDLNAVRAAITPETAGLLIEPIQGEGGIRVVERAYLEGLRALADEHELLLIFDEIQCGMGRTGKLFAYEWTDITPDIMPIAKAIGGGFPLGACLATENAAVGMVPGTHGSTYGGNPLAMAVGNAALDIILEDGFLEQVRDTANFLNQQLGMILERYSGVIEEVRSIGMMIGLKCKVPNTDLINALRARGMLTVGGAENVVRWLPPLIITKDHVRDAIEILDQACADLGVEAKTG
ncbi:MAG TPA: aspartate aminotransferase family protein [Sneathiellales bacterium]|nr:aspartate aminotransferase family protein [Sneathiellales bacterium]